MLGRGRIVPALLLVWAVLAFGDVSFDVDTTQRDVQAAAEYSVNSFLDSTLTEFNDDAEWLVTSARRRKVQVRHDRSLDSMNYFLTINLQVDRLLRSLSPLPHFCLDRLEQSTAAIIAPIPKSSGVTARS